MAGHDTVRHVDAVVVGAGFSGLYALHRLRQLDLQVVVVEAAADVGGTWWWNRYPGARCDIESKDYSYSFSPELEQEWTWSERYATQPEILAYVNHVADRFELRRDIIFDTHVTSAVWDEPTARWVVSTDGAGTFTARFCIMAVGALSNAKRPEIDGIDSFAGPTFHTGQWPHDGVDFSGQRVGVIGTGSSGIQAIPLIAEDAAHLTVFQRTANFAAPAKNALIPAESVAELKGRYREHRAATRASRGGVLVADPTASALSVGPADREARLEEAWESGTLFGLLSSFNDVLLDPEANDVVADFVRAKIRSIVEDPAVAERLCPSGHGIGTKRLCLCTNYYETYNRENVELVDLRLTPIVEIVEQGVRTTDATHPLDALVFATGFDAMTGPLLAFDIVGRDGLRLRDAWAEGPRTYLGIAVAGFPNLFTVTGPGSPSVLVNMMASIEQHIEWTTEVIGHMEAEGIAVIEAEVEAQDTWMRHVADMAAFTLFPTGDSWYLGANVPGKPRVFMPYVGGMVMFRQACDDVASAGYEGFRLVAGTPPGDETIAVGQGT